MKFKAWTAEFVRDVYNTSSDRHKLTEEEINEVLGYKNINEEFIYQDWYGSCTPITATLISVERDGYDSLIFTIKTSKPIPEHYVPTPSQILEHKGLLFPISVY